MIYCATKVKVVKSDDKMSYRSSLLLHGYSVNFDFQYVHPGNLRFKKSDYTFSNYEICKKYVCFYRDKYLVEIYLIQKIYISNKLRRRKEEKRQEEDERCMDDQTAEVD